jgi:GAF domain-containing protein
VNQLRSPITWRLTLLFLLLSLIPIIIVVVFVRQQVRESLITTQLKVVTDHAHIYFSSMKNEPEKKQEFAVDMAKTTEDEVFFLIAKNGTYLAHSNPEKVGKSALEDFNFDTLQKLLARQSTSIIDKENDQLIGSYRTSLTDPVAVSAGSIEKKTAELNIFTHDLLIQLSIAFSIIFIIGGVSVLYSLKPLVELANYANEVGRGNLNFQFDDRKLSGELAMLSSSLKGLAANVQTSIASLEHRVAERTSELEYRSKLFKAVADVGKAVASFRDLSELLQQTTHLIHENFGYYHVGIFLLDEHKEYAVLSATNSEGGRLMLERKHQLKVGETGIVGYVTKNAKARIALDVGEDAVYFNNPELPQTHSEMALPLVVGGQILGALDVQSTESQAFSESDISTLQILAEQIAIAIQNANLFNEAKDALEALRVGYAEVSRGAWNKILHDQPRVGFLATPPSTVQIHSEHIDANLARAVEVGGTIVGNDGLTVSIPVKVRGQVIGAVRLKKSEISEAWTQDETNLAAALSDQLGGALESARLYKQSQQLAARESRISDISARISAVSQTDAILRETVQELGQTIGNASVTFKLLNQLDEQKQAKDDVSSMPKRQGVSGETSDGNRKAGE